LRPARSRCSRCLVSCNGKAPLFLTRQGRLPASSLVTHAAFAPLGANIRGLPPATPAHDSRAAGRESSARFPGASIFGSPACSHRDREGRNNTFVEYGCADRGGTASGGTGIDDVLFFVTGQQILLDPHHAQRSTSARTTAPSSCSRFRHTPKSDHDQRGMLITFRWNPRSRCAGKPDHHRPEYAINGSRRIAFKGPLLF
jgi:hypothetical protein